jgi:hypothetical protein
LTHFFKSRLARLETKYRSRYYGSRQGFWANTANGDDALQCCATEWEIPRLVEKHIELTTLYAERAKIGIDLDDESRSRLSKLAFEMMQAQMQLIFG